VVRSPVRPKSRAVPLLPFPAQPFVQRDSQRRAAWPARPWCTSSASRASRHTVGCALTQTLGVTHTHHAQGPRRERSWSHQVMKPTYFDLTVANVAQARAFFEATLGWRFERFDMPYEYYRIQAGPESEPGIDGGIGSVTDTQLSEGRPMTQVTIPIASLNDALARVVANGGTVVEPRVPIPGIGWYATCAEPGGLKFGLIEADATAK
jgi:predicted enzyme related to lactoylglutathione lyase